MTAVATVRKCRTVAEAETVGALGTTGWVGGLSELRLSSESW